MEVILIESVDSLGNPGDIKEVSAGYARNFLFPRKLAIISNEKNKKLFEAQKLKKEKQLEKQRKESADLASRIDGMSITIARKSGEDDKLFGSVTAADIADALSLQGFTVDKRKIEIERPIKELGIYNVNIKLLPGISSTIKLWVVKE